MLISLLKQTLSSIPEFAYTPEVNQGEQEQEGFQLTQAEQTNNQVERMGVEITIDWGNQRFNHITEKCMSSTSIENARGKL